jgi:aryl-alcohol dehydrogenase-like predicted oxidoreductase
MNRRDFLRAALAITVLPTVRCGSDDAREGPPVAPVTPPDPNAVPQRTLGTTGATVSILGLGGYHMGVPSEEEGVRIVRTAIDGGITFLDNCWDYHAGESERRMGRALRDGYRARAFLMTKIDGRTKAAAARQIDESLANLGVEQVDLMQLHEVIRADDPPRTFEPGGAIEALLEAREAGKVRFLGFTGHKSPAIHLAMLDAARAHGFRWDTVQMPLNVLDAHFDSFEKGVLPRLVEEGIGIIGMKPMADGRIPQLAVAGAEDCLRYAMSLPVSVTVTGCDSLERVEQALRVARGFQPLAEPDVNALLERTRPTGQTGADERYKTTDRYDATTHNPDWLG